MSIEEEEYRDYSSEEYQSDHNNNDDDDNDDDDLFPSGSSVEEQLNFVQKYFEKDDLKKAESSIKKIKPNNQQTRYSYHILHSLISLKQNNIDQCIISAQLASDEQKKELLPYKIQIYAYINRKIELIAPVVEKMFSNAKPDLETMILISKKLHKLTVFNKKHADSYIKAIREDSTLLPSIQYIIPTIDTLDHRISILTEKSTEDIEACSLLVKTLIKEKNDIDKAKSYLGRLPEEHPTRLLFKILFGKNPVENAKILCSQKGNDQHFLDFIKFYENKNIISLERFVQKEPFFSSGWILLSELTNDKVSKCLALKKANEIYSQKEIQRKLEELDSTMIIQDDKGEDLVINSSTKDREDYEESKRIWLEYEKTKNKEELKKILNIGSNFLNAKIKIDAIQELGEELGEEEKMKQLESLKVTKYKKIYNIIAHLYLKRGNIDESVKNFIEDAKLGSTDPICLELVTKKLIEDNQIEESLKLCLKVPDYEWSLFRSGLIYQRLGKHNEAVQMFYKIVRNRTNINVDQDSKQISVDNKICIDVVWNAIAQSYASLNRYMALKDVLSELRKIGKPNLDYESVYKVFQETNFYTKSNYDINSSPIQFYNFLKQLLNDIKMLKWQGRNEACIEIINKYKNIVLEFMEKWNNLGAILKSSGDFFLEGFVLTEDNEMYNNSLKAYKRRAEVDLVPESLVDLSNALYFHGDDQLSMNFLKRGLQKYPKSQIIWMNLGVLFALQSKFSLARHCFIVSSEISYDSQNGKVFSYIAAVEKFYGEFSLMEKAIRSAENMNSMDVSLLQIKSMNGLIKEYDASLTIFESNLVSPNLPRLCIKNGRFIEALGFALMLNNNEEISLAYESLGNFEMALKFTDDEERKNRLQKLICKDVHSSCDGIDDAIDKFKEKKDLISQITAAALYISKNDKIEGCKILRSLLERSRTQTNRKNRKQIHKESHNENNNDNDNNHENNNDNDNNHENNNDNDNNNENNNDNDNNNENNNENDNNNNENNNNNDNNNNNENNSNNDNENNNNVDNSNDNENNNNNGNNNDDNESSNNNAKDNENLNEKQLPIKIPATYMKLILSWLLQYEPPGEKEISHCMIDEDPQLYYLKEKRTENDAKAATKTYHKFMNVNANGVKLFLCLSLKNNYKEINLAKITAAAENLIRLCPSRESYKLLIAAYIKANKLKEAINEIQKLQILDPDEIPKTIGLIHEIKSLI